MKAKELIDKLSELNPEADVTVNMYAGCHGYDDTFEIADVGPVSWDEADRHGAIEVDKGCFCDGHTGTKCYKNATKPQGISEYWKARQEFHKVIEEKIKQSARLGAMYAQPKTLEEMKSKEAYAMVVRILEGLHKEIERKIRGEGDK
jgi:hypothetical protein